MGLLRIFIARRIFQSIQLQAALFISVCKTYETSRHNADIRIFSHRNKSMTNRFPRRVSRGTPCAYREMRSVRDAFGKNTQCVV